MPGSLILAQGPVTQLGVATFVYLIVAGCLAVVLGFLAQWRGLSRRREGLVMALPFACAVYLGLVMSAHWRWSVRNGMDGDFADSIHYAPVGEGWLVCWGDLDQFGWLEKDRCESPSGTDEIRQLGGYGHPVLFGRTRDGAGFTLTLATGEESKFPSPAEAAGAAGLSPDSMEEIEDFYFRVRRSREGSLWTWITLSPLGVALGGALLLLAVGSRQATAPGA